MQGVDNFFTKMEGFRPITQWNDDDRPREKLMQKGRHALSDAELLAILLGTGTRYRDSDGNMVTRSAVDLGKDILQTVGNNLISLARLSTNQLTHVKGIGEAKAITILAAMELGARRKMARDKKAKISCSRNAYEMLAPYVQDLQIEQFWAIFLNKANMVLKIQKFSEGGITGTVMDPGTIFKAALLENAKGIILCHNHPSGNLLPSDADIDITRKLKNAGAQLDIIVQDHLIITAQGYYSFGDSGMMSR